MKLQITGLDSTLRYLKRLRSDLDKKQKEMLQRLAEIGLEDARAGFLVAPYDGINDVSCHVEWDGNICYVVAEGEKVLFIEFGSGINYEAHPRQDLVSAHGTFGQGKGAYEGGWAYYGEMGTNPTADAFVPKDKQGNPKTGLVHTKGNPPARAMYDAGEKIETMIIQIAREVFAS